MWTWSLKCVGSVEQKCPSSYGVNTLPHHRVKTGILVQLFLRSWKSWHSHHNTDDHHHSLSGLLKYIFHHSARKTKSCSEYRTWQDVKNQNIIPLFLPFLQTSSPFTLWMIYGWDSPLVARVIPSIKTERAAFLNWNYEVKLRSGKAGRWWQKLFGYQRREQILLNISKAC